MRVTAQFEVPEADADALALALTEIDERRPGWALLNVTVGYEDMTMSIDVTPICEQCGEPMVFSRELRIYVCSHPS